ncbi:unnamed protein product [Dicrocoelium dendriticum]|nr:unnamed protein product [Dicrocoelium dendriticum]
MSTEGLTNDFVREDPCAFSHETDLLDFLNSSDTEADESKALISSQPDPQSEAESANDDSPAITLSITNVVVMASMQCHLRLKEIARSSVDVEYKALQNHVIMRLRSPYTVATIWSSGKIWCTGANSLTKAKVGARRIARRIAKCGFPCKFSKYRVVNIMATCHLPFRVRLEELVKENPSLMSYEPELSPGLTFKTDPNSSTLLKLFSTGRIVLMGSSMDSISALVEALIPLASLHQTDEPLSESEDEDEKIAKVATREEAAVARQLLQLPSDGLLDTFDYYLHGDYGESDDSDDAYGLTYNHGYSTDDSTDSGASIDSGGMSTKPRVRSKRGRPRGLRMQRDPLTSFSHPPPAPNASVDPNHAVEHIASSLHFATSNSSFQNAVYSNTQNVPSNVQCASADPTWSRKAVASGATKRARVITYSGTEDIDENTPNTRPTNYVPTQTSNQSVQILPSTSTVSPIVVFTSSSLPQNISNSTAQQPQQPQFVVVSATQPMTQSVTSQLGTLQSSVPTNATSVLRFASGHVTAFSQQNGMTPAMYPVRLTAPSMHLTSVHSSIGPKYVSMNPVAQNVSGATTIVNVTNPTYQFIQPSTMLMTPTLYAAPTSSITCQPSHLQITTNPSTFVSGSPGMFVTQFPHTLSPLHSTNLQSFSMVPTSVVHSFVGQPPTKLS